MYTAYWDYWLVLSFCLKIVQTSWIESRPILHLWHRGGTQPLGVLMAQFLPLWHWTSSPGSSRTAPLCKWMLLCLSFLLLCLQASWYRWLLPSRQSSTLAWYMICPVLPAVCFTACLFTFPGWCNRWLLFVRSKRLISFWILLCMLMPYFIWAKPSAFGFIICKWFLVLTFERASRFLKPWSLLSITYTCCKNVMLHFWTWNKL